MLHPFIHFKVECLSLSSIVGRISNPSFISATAKNVSVSVSNRHSDRYNRYITISQVWYKVNDTSKFKIGNGTISNKVIKPNARTNITFPIDITYTTDLDPDNAVLGDLLEKCVFNNQGFDFNINVDVSLYGFSSFVHF